MGKIVSALETNKVKTLSESLLEYGSDVCKLIKQYGGLPIYAGGDDLLFIAPVVSYIDPSKPTSTIFDLLANIDKRYTEVDTIIGTLGRPLNLHTSISYGLSISYYKYPLYEALKSARELLFDKAKNIDGKNAIAWCLRKHSGSGFTGSFCKDSEIYTIFSALLNTSVDETTVSAVAHKLRDNENLLDIIRDKDENRIKAFYKKVMEEEPLNDASYKGITRRLLNALFKQAALQGESSRNDSKNKGF